MALLSTTLQSENVCFHFYLLCLDRWVPIGSLNRKWIFIVSCQNQWWLGPFKLYWVFSPDEWEAVKFRTKTPEWELPSASHTEGFLFRNTTPRRQTQQPVAGKKTQSNNAYALSHFHSFVTWEVGCRLLQAVVVLVSDVTSEWGEVKILFFVTQTTQPSAFKFN